VSLINLIFSFVIVLLSIILLYQDFKTRLINLWLIILFSLCVVLNFLLQHSYLPWLYNVLFSIVYFAFSYLIVWIYLRQKKISLNNAIGLADIILLFVVASVTDYELQIYFFTVFFITCCLIYLVLKKHKTIPMAGYLALFYSIWLIISQIELT
jgi:hypothetical protein